MCTRWSLFAYQNRTAVHTITGQDSVKLCSNDIEKILTYLASCTSQAQGTLSGITNNSSKGVTHHKALTVLTWITRFPLFSNGYMGCHSHPQSMPVRNLCFIHYAIPAVTFETYTQIKHLLVPLADIVEKRKASKSWAHFPNAHRALNIMCLSGERKKKKKKKSEKHNIALKHHHTIYGSEPQ